jgi:hypothetical protein
MPSADFCTGVREPHGPLSPVSRTRCRPPEVSPTAFAAHPPDLQPGPLMDKDFAVSRPLVRPGLPRIRFLFVGSRFRSTLPSDPASRRRPCASLALHLHQVVQGTCTPRLSNMLGTQRTAARGVACRRLARKPLPVASCRPLSCRGRSPYDGPHGTYPDPVVRVESSGRDPAGPRSGVLLEPRHHGTSVSVATTS